MTGTEFDTLMRSLGHSRTSLAAFWGLSRATVGKLCATALVDRHYSDALRFLSVKDMVERIALEIDVDKTVKIVTKRSKK